MKRKLYVAYGSNLHIVQMQQRCPESKLIGKGVIQDHELEFRGVATIKPSPGMNVPVVVWSISKSDELELDRYEGVAHGLYRKEMIEVKLEAGINEQIQPSKVVNAMVYIMNVDEARPISPPSRYYYEVIRQGYLHHGLSFSPLAIAAILSGVSYIDESEDQM
jgi:AIG2-like family.